MLKFLTVFLLCITVFANALFSKSDNVIDLTPNTFDKVVKSDGVVIVKFYSDRCGHCHNAAPEYKKLGTALKGVAQVAAINMGKHQNVGSQYNIKGFPTYLIFGSDKNKPVSYNGDRTAKPMASAVLKEIRELVSSRVNPNNKNKKTTSSSSTPPKAKPGNVVELNTKTFDSIYKDDDMYLVSFVSPNCGYCHQLKPEYRDAASQLRTTKGIKLATIDCTRETSICQRFQIQGYPTIKYFKFGKKSRMGDDYNSERSASSIVTFVKNRLEVDMPPPSASELVNDAVFNECLENTVCLFAVLPDIRESSAASRNTYIKSLNDVVKKNRNLPISYVYSFARQHRKLENILEMGGSGYPSVVIISKSKNRYATMYSSFETDNIVSFVEGVIQGRLSVAPIRANLPKLVTVEKWDGKDHEGKEEL